MVFKTGLTDAEYHTARILMLLLTANLAVSFPMSVFSNIISAQEQFCVPEGNGDPAHGRVPRS